MKFGIVGVIAFIIDWGILNILVGAFHMHNVLAATISFIISLIFNYVASMKMVFKHLTGVGTVETSDEAPFPRGLPV